MKVAGRTIEVPEDVQEKVQERVEVFKENHQNPVNMAMHLGGYGAMVYGVLRVLRRRKVLVGLALVGVGLVLLVVGHRIEGSDAFALLKKD